MANVLNKFYEFPPYRVDTTEKLLLRDGERIPLTPKAFETLLILIERHGHIVEKNELMQMVWPGVAVEENNLNQNISAIRKALGENSLTQQFIETLPRRGYRFIAEVREMAAEERVQPIMALPQMEKSVEALLPTPTPNRRLRVALLTFASLVVLTGILYLLSTKLESASPSTLAPAVKINRLPATSDAWETAISPNGKLVAYVIGDVSNQSLHIKQIDTGADTELLARDEGRFRGLVFAPDNKSLYYAQQEKNVGHVLYQKPIQGGEGKRLLVGADSAVTFSPDGKQLAFVRESQASGESSLVIANADGTGERVLAARKLPKYYAVEGPSWSPDGKLIATAANGADAKFHFQIVTVNVETGAETPVSQQRWDWATKVAWLPNAKGIVAVGRDGQEGIQNDQLWLLDYPSGQAHKLLTDLNTYRGLSLDQTGKMLATVRSETRSSLWVIPPGDPSQARSITTDPGSQPGGDGLDWTPDGRIVYTSLASGHKDLWIMNADGTQTKPLTTEPADNVSSPSVTADGQYVIFNSGRSGLPNIWRIGLDGKAPTRLTHGNLDLQPYCSPLENWVFFSQDSAGKRTISRVKTDGSGPPQSLSDQLTLYPVVSPDGKWVACLYQETLNAPQRVAILPVTGGAPKQLLDIPAALTTSLRWHPDGNSLTYLTRKDGAMNLWRQPLAGGTAEPITDFKTDRIFTYAWSRDGRTLACARGTINRDVIMISDFR